MSDKLTAAELREALTLVLAELENLPTDAMDKAERLGRLQAHLATITDDRNPDAISGLRALRKGREEAPIETP